MSNKVRRAEIIVCSIENAGNQASQGLAAISDSHVLFADANGAEQEILILAAEIVHSSMYFITDEALRIAIKIAESNGDTDGTLKETARYYLAQGKTIAEVRARAKRARAKEKAMFSVPHDATARVEKMLLAGRHLREMRNSEQLVAA